LRRCGRVWHRGVCRMCTECVYLRWRHVCVCGVPIPEMCYCFRRGYAFIRASFLIVRHPTCHSQHVFKLALRGCERCPYLRMRCCYHAMLLPEAKPRCSAQFLEVLFSSIHVSRNLHCLFRCQGFPCKPWQTPRYLLPSLLWIRPIPHPAKATRAPLLWPPELGRCWPGTPALLAQARRRRALEVKQEQSDLPT
jgi:hypothetical protein